MQFLGGSDANLDSIVDFDGLSRWLGEVAVDHPLTPIPPVPVEPAAPEDFAAIPRELAAFIADAECIALTMTVRFEGHGFSVSRLGGGYSLHAYTHPRRDAEEASRWLSLFAERDVQPQSDRLSDGGRTRTLEFPMPSDLETMWPRSARARWRTFARCGAATFSISTFSGVRTSPAHRARTERAETAPESGVILHDAGSDQASSPAPHTRPAGCAIGGEATTRAMARAILAPPLPDGSMGFA